MNPITWLQHPYIVTLVRWLLAGIFLMAAIGKLFDRQRFMQIVLAYAVLPKSLAWMYALTIPWIELVVGIMLLIGLFTKAAAVLTGLLLLSG